MDKILKEEWNGFRGEDWQTEINVSAFIDANYT